ncbi:MAG: tetratricopeptide repeat protein [Anaerolineales bacterium]
MTSNPSGTVTFLFTDIENSTQLAREHPEAWEVAQTRHHAILREAIEFADGFVFQEIGDAFCAAFHKAGDALKAAIKAQQDLQNESWGEVTVGVRMGIHTGEAEAEGKDYRGYLTLSLVQRLMSAGHGGQILVSNATENLLREQLPKQISLRDMGEHRLKDIAHPLRVFQVVAPDLPKDFLPFRTLDVIPNNLPTQLTSFVGREKELADVKKLLHDAHLLTLIGPGGTGKTRLSIQAANELLDQYPDGVWLVELAPILDPLLVPRTTAIALGLRDEPQRPVVDMLCDTLHEKKMLLILDNCEHLVDACALMADKILHAAPNVCILASSREPLGIGGEVSYRVPSLGLPDISHLPPIELMDQYEAVKLFIDRATSAVPSFTVTNDNAPALAQVCHRLDGIPLAIELAAAKIRVLSVDQIAKRLDDRFRLLIGGSRTVLERHQTLRAAIDWSYNLLPPDEQSLFRRLAIFVGGWTLEAAEAVCSDPSTSLPEEQVASLRAGSVLVQSEDVLNLMEQLINKSLVIREEAGHESRYRMLETIRQYANEKLIESAESAALRDRHLKYFLNVAETAEPNLHSEEQGQWLGQLEMEHNNLRAALEWSKAEQQGAEKGLRLAGALWRFWEVRGHYAEGRAQLEAALVRSEPGRTLAQAKALVGAGTLAWYQTDYASATTFHEAALSMQRELGDQQGIAFSLNNLGAQALEQGEYENAANWLEESLALSRELRDRRTSGYALHNLGEVVRHQGDFERAFALYHESLAAFREVRDPWAISLSMIWLGVATQHLGEYDQATAYLKEGLALCLELGIRRGIAEGLEGLAGVAFAQRQSDWALQLFGAADTLRKALHSPMSPADRVEYESILAEVQAAMRESKFKAAWAAGEAMAAEGWEKVITYALAQPIAGDATTHSETSPVIISRNEADKQKYGGLTTREREVAAQIAQGKSNQAIAVELFVGLKTVEAHVTRILSKLGFTSRAQIAGWAVAKGLAEAPTDLDTLARQD